jgi:hypothetical protein
MSAAQDDRGPVDFVLSADDRRECLYKICGHMLWALGVLFLVIVVTLAVVINRPPGLAGGNTPTAGLTPVMVFFIGVLGGYVGLQRRVNSLSDYDLHLIANSWMYSLLAPFVGGVLALLLQYIFVGKILTGPLFPEFKSEGVPDGETGFISVFYIAATAESLGRLIFWSFVAGFSERFVTDMIGNFEKKAAKA